MRIGQFGWKTSIFVVKLLLGKLLSDFFLIFVKFLACCVVPEKLFICQIGLSSKLLLSLLEIRSFPDVRVPHHLQQISFSPQSSDSLQIFAFFFELDLRLDLCLYLSFLSHSF